MRQFLGFSGRFQLIPGCLRFMLGPPRAHFSMIFLDAIVDLRFDRFSCKKHNSEMLGLSEVLGHSTACFILGRVA